jgi:hypothetical protein
MLSPRAPRSRTGLSRQDATPVPACDIVGQQQGRRTLVRHRASLMLGANRARTAANRRTAPDITTADSRPCSYWPGTIFAAWRVKDSNLGRHAPTDLQTVAMV